MANNFTEKASFIWSVADLIRDTFKRGRYQDVILPFTVLRRIDQVLEPAKDAVLQTYHQYKGRFETPLDGLLRKASGYAFYNTSPHLSQLNVFVELSRVGFKFQSMLSWRYE